MYVIMPGDEHYTLTPICNKGNVIKHIQLINWHSCFFPPFLGHPEKATLRVTNRLVFFEKVLYNTLPGNSIWHSGPKVHSHSKPKPHNEVVLCRSGFLVF